MNFFIQPWFLTGLTAASIPVIIHLIFRRRFQRVEWGAMKFLLAAYQSNKTSLLVEHILLLILRILIIILLVLIFARPIAGDIALFSDSRSTEHFILVVDNSYSMGVRDGNQSPFEKAKKQARNIIKNAQIKDSITIITMNEKPRVLTSFATILDTGKIIGHIDEIKLSHQATGLFETMDILKEQASKKEYLNKKVFILTDCQKGPWLGASKDQSFLATLKEIRKEVRLFSLFDVGVTSDPLNLAVSDLEADGVIGLNTLARFVATIQNFSPKESGEMAIHFYVDGNKQSTEYVSVLGGERQRVAFFYNFVATGPHNVMVEIDADSLAQDNKRYLSFDVLQNIKTLVLDGDIQEEAFGSETDYITAAIGATPKSLIQMEVMSVADLSSDIQFSQYNVIILANVQTFADEERFLELEEFARKGGGILFFLGEKVPYKYYNSEFFKEGLGVLPAPIEAEAIGKASDKEDKTVFTFDNIDETHPVLKYFVENKTLLEDFRRCLTYKFFPVQIDALDKEEKRVSVIAHYDDPGKHPAILEKNYERGKVVLFTSTADRAWNNYNSDQFGHVFLIMVHEFIQYLVIRPIHESNIRVGLPILKTFDFYIQGAEIAQPGESFSPIGLQSNNGAAPFRLKEDTFVSGIYKLNLDIPLQVREEQGEIASEYIFAVNVDPTEGDITRATKQEILNALKDINIHYSTRLQKNQSGGTSTSDVEYWKPILILLLILNGLETFLAMWFGRYDR